MIQYLYYTNVNVDVVFVGCKWICPKRPEMTDSDEDGGTYCIYQLYLFFINIFLPAAAVLASCARV